MKRPTAILHGYSIHWLAMFGSALLHGPQTGKCDCKLVPDEGSAKVKIPYKERGLTEKKRLLQLP